jgi:hypothetical protein
VTTRLNAEARHIDLSQSTAGRYMRWARLHHEIGTAGSDLPKSLWDMKSDTERARETRQSKQQQYFCRVLREVKHPTLIVCGWPNARNGAVRLR